MLVITSFISCIEEASRRTTIVVDPVNAVNILDLRYLLQSLADIGPLAEISVD